MSLVLVTPPAVEPISTAEAKLHLRVDHSDEDALIARLITAARKDVETYTRRALITQTQKLVLDDWPYIPFKLLMPPLQSVTSIQYTTRLGSALTFAASNYVVDIYSTPGRLTLADGASWPGDTLREMAGITITYVCGYGTESSAVPEPIRQAILLLVGHYYENREAVLSAVGANVQLLPMGIDSLLAEYRVWSF